jgi:prophage regulatory protein
MNTAPSNAAHRVLRLKEVCERCGISRSSVYVKLNTEHAGHDPSFPRPISLGRRSIGFVESEINAWLLQQFDRRVA